MRPLCTFFGGKIEGKSSDRILLGGAHHPGDPVGSYTTNDTNVTGKTHEKKTGIMIPNWLVVSNMTFIFHFIYGMSSETIDSYFSRWLNPPTSKFLGLGNFRDVFHTVQRCPAVKIWVIAMHRRTPSER